MDRIKATHERRIPFTLPTSVLRAVFKVMGVPVPEYDLVDRK
jgi:hypothetical protein